MWTPRGIPLAVPVIGAPLFIVSTPELVIAQCRSGVVGSIPALNARPIEVLNRWLLTIREALADHDAAHPDTPAAPYAVNLIVHHTNPRLDVDLAACVRHQVPIIIASLGANRAVNDAVHAYGGLVLQDITTLVHARKAVDKGADGLIALAAGAGGHTGSLSPFALIGEIRQWWKGPLILSGSIATGRAILAAQIIGADLAYVGSCFIAAEEANAPEPYKQMVVDSTAADIVCTDHFTGLPANYLRPSIAGAGLDPQNLGPTSASQNAIGDVMPKRWRDIWAAGHGIGAVKAIEPARTIVARLKQDYEDAMARMRICYG